MELVWTPLAVPGLVAFALVVSVAALVWATRPDRAQNRRLAAVLFVGALANAVYVGRLFLVEYAHGLAAVAVFMTLVLVQPLLYLRFLSTLPTPLVAPFRRPAVMGAVAAVTAALVALRFLRLDLFVERVEPFAHTPGWSFEAAPLWNAFMIAFIVVLGYALVVAVDAVRRAPGAAGRAKAKAYAAAFVLRDGALLASIAMFAFVTGTSTPLTNVLNFVLVPVEDIVFSLLLGYGILRYQLFDIDLRIKRGIRGTTLAAAFVAVAFVVSEGAAILFEGWTGSQWLGIGAAALLVFAIAPIQRLADRVADTAMPRVTATPEYLAFRKLEVYREAVESMLADGNVTPKERAALERLRVRLGVAAEDAAALEADARGRLTLPAPQSS